MKFDTFQIVSYLAEFSFYLFIAEMIGVHLFWRFFYMIGPRIHNMSADMPCPSLEPSRSPIIMEDGKFKFVNDNQVLFTSRIKWLFGLLPHISTICKGIATCKSNRIEILVRFPLGVTLFCFAWLVGWTTALIESNHLIWAFLSFVIATGIGAAVISREKKNVEKLLYELTLILKTDK
jgi:hypothetical protein